MAVRPPDDPFLIAKPASKLANSWIAGVLPILGNEPAFRSEGNIGVNYLEAVAPEEVIVELKKLKGDQALRNQILNEGRKKAPEFQANSVVQNWISLIEDKLIPLHRNWVSFPGARQRLFLKHRKSFWQGRAIKQKLSVKIGRKFDHFR
ncbi:hypothetical protein SH580_16340 [Coraliomargarita algicola]|uniref:Uncharacterized protein n=1 Tax=Coraliomargarita algicola TaxID=3092156 RepID=A0ABZ0RHQ4_9BACT|nr:hypothetical protein [Coraliomargarita sp. J2-16]WPJ94998.1 hypothetical protein SH580_16340 [Coraliomargarita sp. J2-16]